MRLAVLPNSHNAAAVVVVVVAVVVVVVTKRLTELIELSRQQQAWSS